MNKELIKHGDYEFKRISKIMVKKALKNKKMVLMLPINLKFDNIWIKPHLVTNDNFESQINKYIYYNCNNSELGTYPKFYIQV